MAPGYWRHEHQTRPYLIKMHARNSLTSLSGASRRGVQAYTLVSERLRLITSKNTKICVNANLLLVACTRGLFSKHSTKEAVWEKPKHRPMPVLEPKPSLTRAHTQTQMKGMCVAANVAKLCIGRYTPKTEYGSVPKQGKKHVGGKGTIWVGNVFEKESGRRYV